MFITLTACRICVPTPTPATAAAPRRPTISVSISPTSDSSPKVMIAGQASDQTMRIRSSRDAVAGMAPMLIGGAGLELIGGCGEVRRIGRACQLTRFHDARVGPLSVVRFPLFVVVVRAENGQRITDNVLSQHLHDHRPALREAVQRRRPMRAAALRAAAGAAGRWRGSSCGSSAGRAAAEDALVDLLQLAEREGRRQQAVDEVGVGELGAQALAARRRPIAS